MIVQSFMLAHMQRRHRADDVPPWLHTRVVNHLRTEGVDLPWLTRDVSVWLCTLVVIGLIPMVESFAGMRFWMSALVFLLSLLPVLLVVRCVVCEYLSCMALLERSGEIYAQAAQAVMARLTAHERMQYEHYRQTGTVLVEGVPA